MAVEAIDLSIKSLKRQVLDDTEEINEGFNDLIQQVDALIAVKLGVKRTHAFNKQAKATPVP